MVNVPWSTVAVGPAICKPSCSYAFIEMIGTDTLTKSSPVNAADSTVGATTTRLAPRVFAAFTASSATVSTVSPSPSRRVFSGVSNGPADAPSVTSNTLGATGSAPRLAHRCPGWGVPPPSTPPPGWGPASDGARRSQAPSGGHRVLDVGARQGRNQTEAWPRFPRGRRDLGRRDRVERRTGPACSKVNVAHAEGPLNPDQPQTRAWSDSSQFALRVSPTCTDLPTNKCGKAVSTGTAVRRAICKAFGDGRTSSLRQSVPVAAVVISAPPARRPRSRGGVGRGRGRRGRRRGPRRGLRRRSGRAGRGR